MAGKAPFAAEASTGLAPLVARILQGDPPVITRPGVPPELERLLRTSMAAEAQDRPASAELGIALTELGQRLAAEQIDEQALVPAPAAPPLSTRRLLFVLLGAMGILLTAFTAWGPGQRAPEPDQLSPNAVAAEAAQAAGTYAPKDVVVSPGPDKGELIVSWSMPIRPDVVATVIYEGAGAAKARAIVSYHNSPQVVPRVTLRGLHSGQQVCLSAAHVVSLGDVITNAVNRAVCAVPR